MALRVVAWLLALSGWHGLAFGQERVRHALGEFEYLASASGVLIAAPHGTYDLHSDAIAVAAARHLGAGYLVARQFTVNRIRINVNRPTEGASLACAQEPVTPRAQDVYAVYAGLVSAAAAARPLRLYVEVHGNANARSQDRVEVATTGLSVAAADKVKRAYPAMLAQVREQVAAYPELALWLEPVDRVFFTASCAKQLGMLGAQPAPRTVHFEFPRAAREGGAIGGSALLVAGVVRSVLDAGP